MGDDKALIDRLSVSFRMLIGAPVYSSSCVEIDIPVKTSVGLWAFQLEFRLSRMEPDNGDTPSEPRILSGSRICELVMLILPARILGIDMTFTQDI